jgi:transposase-like protein
MVVSKEYTVALALTSKTDLWVIWMYRSHVRPSDIARLLNIPKTVVKNVVGDKVKKVDTSLIDDPKAFKYLVNLPNVFVEVGDGRFRCVLCWRTYRKAHLTQHLLTKHQNYVRSYLEGLRNGG